MYDLSLLITHLQQDARLVGIEIGWAKDKEPSFVSNRNSRILIGYHSVGQLGHLGEGQAPEAFVSFTEDMSQTFQTQIICPTTTFAATWNLLATVIVGWVPYIPNRDFTSVMHSGGGVMGGDQGQLWWADNWRIDFSKG